MIPLTRVTGRAIRLPRDNVDTDVIIPAEHLKTVSKTGLGAYAFETLRAHPGNPFDDPATFRAPILLALDNFGCGSSREHAAWAMADLGLSAVIATSFSDIFAGNAFRNGLATIALERSALIALLATGSGEQFVIDLEAQTVTSGAGHRFAFAMDPFRRACLMAGQDEIDLTLASEGAISAFEQGRAAA